MLGYLTHSEGNRNLRQATLTSHVQTLCATIPPAPNGSNTLNSVLEQLKEAKESLWSPWIPQMIGGNTSATLS